MLRIAVPNKGTLSETAVQMLQEAGYATRRDPKELIVSDARKRRRVLLPAPP
jgi:ATP phosphoribosyltransferase